MKLWEMPIPPTALFYDPLFAVEGGRKCSLKLSFEDENYNPTALKVFFHGVESFRCTYFRSIDISLRQASYGSVLELFDSDFLSMIKCANKEVSSLRHLAITFDDGPCYEFICTGFTIKS